MSNVERIPVQAFNFKDICTTIAMYAKQGYSVVNSDKLSEAPQHTGRVYSCWMERAVSGAVKKEVVVEEKTETKPEPEETMDDEQKAEQWESGELGQSEEHVVVSPDFDSMTKKEVEAYAKEKFGVDLDRRMSKTKMIAEVRKLG